MKYSRLILTLSVAFGLGLARVVAQDAGEIATKFDKNPVPVRTPPPEYPSTMQGVDGIVSVVVVIDEQGSVMNASVAKASNPEFEQPSLEAIRKWKFKPAEVGGQPVKAKIAIPLHFSSKA